MVKASYATADVRGLTAKAEPRAEALSKGLPGNRTETLRRLRRGS
jgi:hypothetical protein